jgi:hypothetical protein
MTNLDTVITEMEAYLRQHEENQRNGASPSGVVSVSEMRMQRWVALLKEAKKEE